ncbi:carbohydrate-binding module family 18 protein, partial [Aulographum hederae CBS 113979]
AVAPESATELPPSSDGKCGKAAGETCWLSFFGNCCGKDGKCGATKEACGAGCQTGYGFC